MSPEAVEYDKCAKCGKNIGLAERANGQPVDGPADRWQCAACKKDFCVNCYGRDHSLAPLNHDCESNLGDVQERFGVSASSETVNKKVGK